MTDNEQKIKIQLEIYDEIIEVNVNSGDEERYRNAANYITRKQETYVHRYKGTKGTCSIYLMTMLDIALNPMPGNDQLISFWGKIMKHLKLLQK